MIYRRTLTWATAAIAASSLVAATWFAASDSRASGELSIATLQAAYDAENKPGNAKHDAGLEILEAQCDERQPGVYSCLVGFTSRSDPERKLHYDVAELARTSNAWALKSGLCKHEG